MEGVIKDWPITPRIRLFWGIKQVIRNLRFRCIVGLTESFSLIPCGLNLDKYISNGENTRGNSKLVKVALPVDGSRNA